MLEISSATHRPITRLRLPVERRRYVPTLGSYDRRKGRVLCRLQSVSLFGFRYTGGEILQLFIITIELLLIETFSLLASLASPFQCFIASPAMFIGPF